MIAPLFATDVDRCRPTLKGAATNIGIILGKTSHGLTDIDPDCGESGERHTTIQATSLAKRLREGMERNLVDIVATWASTWFRVSRIWAVALRLRPGPPTGRRK